MFILFLPFALRRVFRFVLLVVLGFPGALHQRGAAATSDDPRTISLIMSDAGFNAELIPLLKEGVARQGFTLKWVVINDIIQPNKLVNDGAAEANSFQHEPYFDQFVADHGLKNIVRGFYTSFTPSGLYSRKYKSLTDLPDGATIGIPVDPANNGRALFMLRDHGLITLRKGVSVTHASVRDIIANPRRLQFREVDQMMLTRTFDNVDVGFLFSANAMRAGLNPRTDALALEQVGSSPYKGVIAVNRSLLGTPKLAALRRAYFSPEIQAFYQKRYGDAIIFLDAYNAPTASTPVALADAESARAGTPLPAALAIATTPPPAATPAAAPTPAPTTATPAPAEPFWTKLASLAPEIRKATLETLFMLVVTIPLAVLFGLPLGTILFLTRPGSFVHAPRLYLVLNAGVNLVRSFPFLILLIAMIPVTKLLVGSALGTLGAIVPMVVNSIPYFARFVEQNLLEVNRGVIEAATSMGANLRQIVWKVLFVEARSGIAGSITILTVSFLSYSTVAGLVGGGGIGDFAIRYGYYRYETDIMVATIVLIIAAVQTLQFGGNALVRKLDKRL